MKKRKLLCVLLASLLLATPAFASSGEAIPAAPDAEEQVQLPEQAPPTEAPVQTFQTETPIIDVVLPNTGVVIVNPYGLPVTVDGQETREQVAGSVMVLENRGNTAVDVSVSAVGTAWGGVVLSERPPAGDALEKAIFLYAEFQATEAPGLTAPWQEYFSDTSNQLLVTSYGQSKDGLMRLEAAGLPYSWGAVRLFGSAAASPAQPWEAGDGFHVSLAFTFTPVTAVISDGSSDFDSMLVLPAEPEPPQQPSEPLEEPSELPEEPSEPLEEPSELPEEPPELPEEPSEPPEELSEPPEEPSEPPEEPSEPPEEPSEPPEEPSELPEERESLGP